MGRARESLQERGCSFERIQTKSSVTLSWLQVECHPYLSQRELLSHCRSVAVCVTAYSPLGSGDRPWASPSEPCLLEEPKLGAIAQRLHKSPAQVILR